MVQSSDDDVQVLGAGQPGKGLISLSSTDGSGSEWADEQDAEAWNVWELTGSEAEAEEEMMDGPLDERPPSWLASYTQQRRREQQQHASIAEGVQQDAAGPSSAFEFVATRDPQTPIYSGRAPRASIRKESLRHADLARSEPPAVPRNVGEPLSASDRPTGGDMGLQGGVYRQGN